MIPQPADQAPTRRTVAKGAAWAVPAVAVGSVIPAASASAADCSAVSVTASCATNALTQKFCISSSQPIAVGSKFAFSASISLFFLGSRPAVTPNFTTLAPYLTATGSTTSGYFLTVVTAIPAGTQLCFTSRASGGFNYAVVGTINAININGGSDCAGGEPSDSARSRSDFLGNESCR